MFFSKRLIFVLELGYLFFILISVNYSLAQVFSSLPDPNFNITFDSHVNKIVVDPRTNIVYVGGKFSRVNLDEIGIGLPISATSGQLIRNFAVVKPDGEIYSIISDQQGGWYIGGSFSYVFDPGVNSLVYKRNLIHILPNGHLDNSFNPDPDGSVTALYLFDNKLYVGGRFLNIGNGINRQNRKYLAVLDLNGNPISSFLVNNIGFPSIEKILVTSSTIYVGGNFETIAGATRTNIAAFDLNGNLLPWKTPTITSSLSFLGLPLSPYVRAIAVTTSTVYLGGVFNQVGDATITNFAAFDINTGDLLPIDFQVDDFVYDLELVSSTLYIAGAFEKILGATNSFIAAIDVNNHSLLPFNPKPNNLVFDIEVNSSTIYLAGEFNIISTTPRLYLGAVDLNGNLLPWESVKPNDYLGKIAISGDVLYIGTGIFGYFNGVGGIERRCLVAIDGNTGTILPWDPDLYWISYYGIKFCNVFDLLLTTTTLYVAGDFDFSGSTERKYLASFHINNGYPGSLTGWNPNPDNIVFTLNKDDNNLYVGGYFNNIGGQARKKVASFRLFDGIITNWNPIASGSSVLTIEIDKNTNKIYLGGYLSMDQSGQQLYNLVAVDSNGNVVWRPNFDGSVTKIYLNSSTLYTAGNFKYVNGVNKPRIAFFDLNQNPPNLTSNPFFEMEYSGQRSAEWVTINDFMVTSSKLYIAGKFSRAMNQPRNSIVGINLDNSNLLKFNPNFNASNALIETLALGPNSLYVGGYFNQINSSTYLNFAKFNAVSPPVISNDQLKDALGNVYSSKNLPPNTSQVIIAFETDKPSICKYSNVPNVSFEAMSRLTFSSQNNTYHTTTIDNLQDNTNYNFYFRCQDLNNEDAVNTQDYLINFSVNYSPSPPQISNIKLNNTYNNNSTLPANTNQVTLTFNTDKNAICRYSTTANTSFDNMTNNITTNNGLSHSTTFSNLQNNTSYTYYLRCQDATNPDLKNTEDYVVNFSIAQVTTGSSGGGGGGFTGGGGGGGSRVISPSTTTTTSDEALRLWLLQFVNQLLSQKQTATSSQKQTTITPTFKSKIKGIPDGFQFTRTLKFGMKGQDVKYLQIFLRAQGKSIYPERKVTGTFGGATRKAVIRFQEKYKKELKIKKADGIVQGATLRKINNMIRGK
ncbi:MAG: hypothetical protein KatS3mg095_0615 [Candidatus Parcubacteria bacterium]|nr:MAG: hypothetical protein KatS3mg095_0615 [Candidatus Parcubacteria bacterium]